MSVGLIDLNIMDDIANAINQKLSSSGTMTPSEMATNIDSISTASDVRLGAGSFSVNGVYLASSDNLDGYNTVTISVPNTYTSSDNGKVVQGNALVAQTSSTVTQNTTLDTTTINSVTVSLPLDSITVSNNGTYYASSNNLEGFTQIEVSLPLDSISVSSNGTYYANSYSLRGFTSVEVSTPVVTLTSLSVSANDTYTASSGYGYDVVTVNVPTSGGSDYDPFSGTDVVESVTTTCDLLSSSTGDFYTTYSNSRINTLEISSSPSNSFFQYLNSSTYPNQVLFNKLIIASGVTLMASCYSGHTDIKEVIINGKLNSFEQGGHFQSCPMLKKVDMSNMTGASSGTSGTGNVMHDSFKFCSTLKEIIIPSDVTALGDNFADGCYSLKSINTDNIIKLNKQTFQNCYSLQKLNLNNLTHLGTISSDNGTFQNSGIEEINLPNLTEWIASSTFSNCKNLRKVISLGTQITSIPGNSFQYCINLKTVPIPSTVTSIGSSAFQGCKALKNIIIPAEVTTIGSNAFYDCISLDWIQFLSTNPPNVQYSSTFQNIPTTCKIYVPIGTLSDYTSANNYPSSSTYTYIEGSPPST